MAFEAVARPARVVDALGTLLTSESERKFNLMLLNDVFKFTIIKVFS